MADFTEAIGWIQEEARMARDEAAFQRCIGPERVEVAGQLEDNARNLDRAAAVLEAWGEISAEDWAEAVDSIDALAWRGHGGEIAAKFRALRDALERR